MTRRPQSENIRPRSNYGIKK